MSAPRLTPRQVQVADLLVRDMTNKEIAAALGVSAHTVKFHVCDVVTSLGARSRVGAAVAWVRLNAVDPTDARTIPALEGQP